MASGRNVSLTTLKDKSRKTAEPVAWRKSNNG